MAMAFPRQGRIREGIRLPPALLPPLVLAAATSVIVWLVHDWLIMALGRSSAVGLAVAAASFTLLLLLAYRLLSAGTTGSIGPGAQKMRVQLATASANHQRRTGQARRSVRRLLMK